MKKSTKLALLWTLCLTLLWGLFLFAGLYLQLVWTSDMTLVMSHREYLSSWWKICLLVPTITGSCAFYAVVRLHRSWRAWTGYLAAVIALVFFALTTYVIAYYAVSANIGMKARNAARELPPEQFMEFLQGLPQRENTRLSIWENSQALHVLFKRPEFTPEMLHQAAEMFVSEFQNGSNHTTVKMWLVTLHPNVDERTLTILAEVPDPLVQGLVASQPKTPVEILRKLSQEKNERIDRGLARNPNTPTDILHDLTSSSGERVLWHLAMNPNTSKEDLAMLAKSPYQDSESPNVHRALAKNPNTPMEALDDLADVPDNIYVRRSVLKHSNTSEETLAKLTKNPDIEIRHSIHSMAKDENSSEKILKVLAQYPDVRVRVAVLKNPNCPKEIKAVMLERLRNEPDDQYGTLKAYFEEIAKSESAKP